MDRTPCRNIWTLLSLMIRTMLLISVQLSPEQQQSVAVNHMTGQQREPIYQTSSHHAVEQSSMLGTFFVALASSTETAVEDNNSSLENVSTVMNKDATLDSAPLKEPQQQRHSEPPKNKHQRHGDDHLISTKTTVNEVEHNFDIDFNYEAKSGKNLVNVKGSLKNHCQFWKNVVNASDYILNVIALGYILPFVSEPTSVMLRNNLS